MTTQRGGDEDDDGPHCRLREAAQTRVAGAARQRGNTRVPEDTIWPLEPHTGVKHDIYDGYLDAWFPIILRTFGSGTYAEGFAGPGKLWPRNRCKMPRTVADPWMA